VRQYRSKHQHRGDDELNWYASHPFEKALKLAVLSRTPRANGKGDKRHDHQRLIPQPVLEEAYDALRKKNLQKCKSFKSLHDAIETATDHILGIGELAVFDFACRIGAKLRLSPDLVYLHAGARTGAKALNLRGRTLNVTDLPKEFQTLSPRHIEDCLCIHADDLARINGRS
jgi:hypothetical protein